MAPIWQKKASQQQSSRTKTKTLRAVQVSFLVFVALSSLAILNEYTFYHDVRRGLCESGRIEEANILFSEPRGLTSTIVAYIDSALNAEEDPCETNFPQVGIFDEYPPVTHGSGDNIPRRPVGTYAYALTITRCPEWYEPDVDGTVDPGVDLYEASAIIKDEICNATATSLLLNGNDPNGNTGQTLYAIVNPNGVTCPTPDGGLYDRVSMLQDMEYRVEIHGQPITNDDLLANGHTYINEHIESDVGIRDTTKLHAFSFVEHPVMIMYDYDCIFRYRIVDAIKSLEANPDLKGYFVRSSPCDANGSTLIDTTFMIIKPSIEEYNNIRNTYLSTPYDPTTGWNGQGHNQCDGKLGLAGFLSYYFSITPGYEELDRCRYSFTADDECIQQNVKEDATTALEICNVLESGGNQSNLQTQEGIVANEAATSSTKPIDQVRVMEVNEAHPQVSAQVVEEDYVVIMEVYVQILVSVRMMIRKTVNGVTTTEMVMSNMWITTKQIIEQISIDPSLIQVPQIVENPVAGAMVSAAVTRPVMAKRSTDICGKPTDCPLDDPTWSRSQQMACQELHSIHFLDKRRTELAMNNIEMSDLVGQFKPMSFHGYCTGAGPTNYLGMKDEVATVKEDWQIVCEPMVCPYGSYVTSSCECSLIANPCSACPTGTRCQTEPVLMCIDCECGLCGKNSDSCCQSNGSNECSSSGSSECLLDNSFFAAVAGTGSSCTNSVSMGATAVPPGCGCTPDRAAPCTYDGNKKQSDLNCFICNASDLAAGECPACDDCLFTFNSCAKSSTTVAEYEGCLASISVDNRNECKDSCKKW